MAGRTDGQAGRTLGWMQLAPQPDGSPTNWSLILPIRVILRQHRAQPRILKRALILSVANTLTEDESDLRQIRNFWPSYHAGQGVLAYTGRSQGYHSLFWEGFKDKLAADGIVVENIEFPIMAARLDHWPASCPQAAKSANQEPEEIRAEIAEAVANVPTAYHISECNADLLEPSSMSLTHDLILQPWND